MILLDTNVISEPQRRDSLQDNLDKRQYYSKYGFGNHH
jgi:hypothetical protein